MPLELIKGRVGVFGADAEIGIVGDEDLVSVVITAKDEDMTDVFVGTEPSLDDDRNVVSN